MVTMEHIWQMSFYLVLRTLRRRVHTSTLKDELNKRGELEEIVYYNMNGFQTKNNGDDNHDRAVVTDN